MKNWYTIWFKQKRLHDGSKWTIYLSYGQSAEEAIQRVEAERHREGYLDWARTEDTEAVPVDEEEYKAGLLKVYICH